MIEMSVIWIWKWEEREREMKEVKWKKATCGSVKDYWLFWSYNYHPLSFNAFILYFYSLRQYKKVSSGYEKRRLLLCNSYLCLYDFKLNINSIDKSIGLRCEIKHRQIKKKIAECLKRNNFSITSKIRIRMK